jgi:hypothetical protein
LFAAMPRKLAMFRQNLAVPRPIDTPNVTEE